MADYFTNFSVIVELPTEEAEKYALHLAAQASSVHQGDEMPDDFPAEFRDIIEDWQFEAHADQSSNGWGIWLHSSSGGIDAVCAFIQHLLERFDPAGHVALEWSNDCSKPRVDAFGGGAAIITATRIKTISTNQWLHRHTASLQAAKPR